MEKRMIKKLLALLMIITILAADFFVLGSNLITYAAQIVSATDNPNIEFSAYFKNQKTREHSIDSSIKNQNLKLYAEIKVNGDDGYLVNGTTIEVLDSNFNITSSNKGKVEGNKVILNQISAGETVEVELGIAPIISDKITTNFLSKTSIVKLNSTYKYSQAEEGESITANREVCVNYQPDSEAVAELETKMITNQVLSVSGTNKRIVQLLIKSKLTENQYPVESTKLTVNVPQIGEVVPTVTVIALGKLATNGTTQISNIDNANGTLTITLNNQPDVKKQVNWSKNGCDELVVTYEYPSTVELSDTQLITTSEIKLYNLEKPKTQTQTKTVGNDELSQVVIGKTEITTEELYKGQLYANTTATEKVNVQYETKTTLGITKTGIADQITIHEGADAFGTSDTELLANTKYISTEINKAQMLEILGDKANIQIKNGETPIATITKDTKANESGNIVIKYETDLKELKIITNEPEKVGILELKHTKAITEMDYDRDEIKLVKTLKTKNTTLATLTGTKIVENSMENNIELKETKSKAELTVNKQNLSTTSVNEVMLGIKLITDGVQYDLYKDPIIKIQLPLAVESVELKGKPSKLYADEFEISSSYNPESKMLEIALDGEQTSYPESSATQTYLQLNLNITLSKLTATQTDKITMEYTNKNATQYDEGLIGAGIVEQKIGISAPSGLIKVFNLSSNTNTSFTETIKQKITEDHAGKQLTFETSLVNNTESDMSNVRILGKLPTTGVETNTFETILESVIAPNATVYYTENVGATADTEDATNGWTTDLANLTNAKLYLIKLDKLIKGSNYTALLKVKIPKTIEKDTKSYTEYQVIYDTDTQTDVTESSRKIDLLAVSKMDVNLTAQVGQEILKNGDIVKEGEVIKYTVSVKNNTEEPLENLEIKGSVPTGTVVVEPMEDYVYSVGYYKEITDEAKINEITSKSNIRLESNQTYVIQYEVRVNADITAGTEISNQATVIHNDSQLKSEEIKNKVEESDIRVTIKRASDEQVQFVAGAEIKYSVYIENLSNETIKDLEMKFISNTSEVTRIESATMNLYGEKITEKVSVDEIQPNDIKSFLIRAKIKEKAENVEATIIINDSNGELYRANTVKEVLPYADAKITLLSNPENNSCVKYGDIIKYNIVVENTGTVKGQMVVSDIIPNCLKVQSISVNGVVEVQTTNITESATYTPIIENNIFNTLYLNPGEKGYIEIETVVDYIPNKYEINTITNKASVEVLGALTRTTEEVNHMLTVDGKPIEDVKNKINGFVWLDTNANGKKDKDENTLAGTKVKVYNLSTNNYVIETITDAKGEYTFIKIPNGSYKVIYEHDMEEYQPTKYSAKGDSKAYLQNLIVGEEQITVAATEAIELNDNITGINLGLKEKEEIPPGDSAQPENPEEPENPEQPETPELPGQPENPEAPEDKKLISGFAWLDSDRNGQKDNGEAALSGIKIRLYNISTKNYLTDNNGNKVETTTDSEGKYTFTDIEKGSYILIVEYDPEKYLPTAYLAEGVDTTKNSKVVLKNININGQEISAAVTDTIDVQDDVSNINIGLKENLIFDLELNKYISRIVVQNSKETKAYDYENNTFAKVEIHRKQIQDTLVVLEYTIKVKNNGEIAGYAKNIVDYLPSGLTFSSELNKDWYLSGSYLYTKGLESVEIKPGEEKEVKLILTKALTNENVGLINNRAEIFEDYNKFGEVDIDSKPNNQIQDEDDLGTVDVIIGISTGGSSMAYTILLMINIVLIGIAIRLMIKNKIIRISRKKGRR